MKVFFQRYWWIWIVTGVGIVLLGLEAYNIFTHNQSQPRTADGTFVSPGKDGQGRAFTAKELKAAETALKNGIKIDDPQNDWYQFAPGTKEPDGRPDNPAPYPLGWTDLRSVSVGSDQGYIYFKFQFWDTFPKKGVSYNGDLIRDTGAQITQFTFLNQAGEPDTAELGAAIFFLGMKNGQWAPASHVTIGAGAMITPVGQGEYLEIQYQTQTSAGMIDGGPGHDYLLAAFPLSMFNLAPGDEVSFGIATETGSIAFHHEVVDLVLNQPGSKNSATIKYRLGSNSYAAVDNPEGTK